MAKSLAKRCESFGGKISYQSRDPDPALRRKAELEFLLFLRVDGPHVFFFLCIKTPVGFLGVLRPPLQPDLLDQDGDGDHRPPPPPPPPSDRMRRLLRLPPRPRRRHPVSQIPFKFNLPPPRSAFPKMRRNLNLFFPPCLLFGLRCVPIVVRPSQLARVIPCDIYSAWR